MPQLRRTGPKLFGALLATALVVVLIVALPGPRKERAPRDPAPAAAGGIGIQRDGARSALVDEAGARLRETEAEVSDPRLVALPGGGRAALWSERSAGAARAWYALDPGAGRGWQRPRATDHALALRRAPFTPEPPDAPRGAAHHAGPGRLYLVQFALPPTRAMRAALEEQGARVHHPVPHNARLVHAEPAVAAALEALPFVRWVGPYLPELRVEAALAEQPDLGPTRVYVQVLERGPEQKQQVAARIEQLGGRIEALIPEGFRLEATLDGAQLRAVSSLDEVLWIDRWSPAENDLALVRSVGGADTLEAWTGFSGEGVRGEVMDDNVRATHIAFQSNPILFHGAHSGDGDHGTKTTGCVFGDGSGLPTARALLPDGQPIFADYGHLYNRYAHTAALVSPAWRAVFQSNSWGTGLTTEYTSTSMQLDDILFDHDLVIVQSQSNSGNQLSRPQAWAKNVISVGAVRHYNSPSPLDDAWAGTGSVGPAADGRIKPDLCFWYDLIQTTDDDSDSDYTSGFSGTSAATPCVAGFVGLVQQMWSEGVLGNTPSGSDLFERRAHASTVRALLVNSAARYAFSGASHDLTRTHQGWGVPDVRELYEQRDALFVVDESDLLAELQTKSYALEVPAGTPSLRATLVYTDLPGTTSASLHRVNDLSLRVTAPDGKVYWGNHGLELGNESVPGGSSDTRNPIECVFVSSPATGTWTVEVIADELAGDGHVETPELDADFALVVCGVLPPGDCAPPTVYCQAKPTSLGTLPAIGHQGSPSVGSGGFAVTVQGAVPGQPAVVFRGPAPANVPFWGGTRCVAQPLVRGVPTWLDANGAGQFPIDLSGQTPGERGCFQVWFRDPLDPTGFGIGLSDGLDLVYCP